MFQGNFSMSQAQSGQQREEGEGEDDEPQNGMLGQITAFHRNAGRQRETLLLTISVCQEKRLERHATPTTDPHRRNGNLLLTGSPVDDKAAGCISSRFWGSKREEAYILSFTVFSAPVLSGTYRPAGRETRPR